MRFLRWAMAGFFSLLIAAVPVWSAEGPSAKTMSAEVRIGTSIDGHKLQGESAVFPDSPDLLIGWSWIKNASGPTDITHEWVYRDKLVSTVVLPVRSSSFRTFSKKSLEGKPGPWELRVKNAEGELLGRVAFEVKSAGAKPKP